MRKLTLNERETLERIRQQGFNWIARDLDDDLFIYSRKVKRYNNEEWHSVDNCYVCMGCNKSLFEFIKWEDQKAVNISELLNNIDSLNDTIYNQANSISPYHLSKEEQEELKIMEEDGYRFIVRDANGHLNICRYRPCKCKRFWNVGNTYERINKELFSFIIWEDEEPTKIKNLLR